MEAVQWIYGKISALNLPVQTGSIKGNPIGNILILETDWDTRGSKDGIHSDMPTVTVRIFRSTHADCLAVFNQIRAVISADLANDIRGAKIVGREGMYLNENEMYVLSIEIDVRQNI